MHNIHICNLTISLPGIKLQWLCHPILISHQQRETEIECDREDEERVGKREDMVRVHLCVCDGDFTLHLFHSLITHSSYRYFSEPVTTLSNICQEADSMIVESHIKQKLVLVIAAMSQFNTAYQVF